MRLDHLLSKRSSAKAEAFARNRARATAALLRRESECTEPRAQRKLDSALSYSLLFPYMRMHFGMCSTPWGYSSVARAVALQAIGQGFKSPYLQSTCSLKSLGKGEGACFCRTPEIRRGSAQRRKGRIDYRLSHLRHDLSPSFGTISEAVDPGTAMQCPHPELR